MAGLGNLPQQAAAPTPQAPQDGSPQDGAGEEGNASPEEQKMYEDFVHAALGVIYPGGGHEVAPQILADLKGQFDPQVLALFDKADPALTDSPQDSAAATGVILTLMVDQKFGLGAKGEEQAQAQADDSQPDFAAVLLHAGKAIVEELLEVSEAAGIHDFNDQDIEAVWARANALYLVAGEAMGAPGANRNALSAEFGKLVDADKQGSLNKVLPGLPGGAPMKQEAA